MGELSRKLEEVLPAYIDFEIDDPAEREVIAEQIEHDAELQESIQELHNVGFWLHEYYSAVGRAPAPEGVAPKPATLEEPSTDGPSMAAAPGPNLDKPASAKRWGAIGESSESLKPVEDGAAWAANESRSLVSKSPVTTQSNASSPLKKTAEARPSPISDDLAALVGRELGGYRIVSEIARGGMGTVFKAIQLSMERPVALKVLAPRLQGDEAFVRRFAREARSAAQIDHPNIVRIYDVGMVDQYSFFSMELIEGRDLKEVLTEKGCIEPEETLRYGIQACHALEAAQAQGVVHRDIKPANMLICNMTGTVKIADMGLAKETSSADGSITMDRTVMGSPNYMAPEQAEDLRKTDHQTDVYGLGASLLHMLTGKVPFGRGKPVEVIARVLTQKLPIPETVHGKALDANLKRIIRKAMAKDRAERYTDAASLRQDLEAYVAGGSARRPRTGTDSTASARLAKGGARYRGAGRSVRSHRKLEASRPSMLVMLLSGVAGFILVALLARAMIPGSGPPIDEGERTAKANATEIKPKETRGPTVAEAAAIEAELRVKRAKSFEDWSAKLRSGQGEYASALAEIKKLEIQADKELSDRIATFLVEESKVDDRVSESLKDLDQARVLEQIRQRRGKIEDLKKTVAYHPSAERLNSALELLESAEVQWVERRRKLVTKLLADGQFSQAEKSAGEARDLLAKAGGLGSTESGVVDLFARIEEAKAAKNAALAQAVAREQLKQWLRESYTKLRGKSLADYRDRIAFLGQERSKPANATMGEELGRHISELGIASGVLEDAVARLGRLTGFQELNLADNRRIEGVITKTGDDRFALKNNADFTAFQAHELSTAELITRAREGRAPDARAEAVFSVFRGEFKRGRKRLADARVEAPGILPGFDDRLKAYSELEAEVLLASLGRIGEGSPKSSERSIIERLLDDGEMGLTDAVASLKEQLAAWAKSKDGKKPKDDVVLAVDIPEPKGDPDKKIAKLFKAPVVGQGLIAITYAFENEEEREDFGKKRLFPDNKRTNDFLNKAVVKASRPPLYRNKGYEAWQVKDKRLWGRGWERAHHKARWAPAYLRIDVQAYQYNGKNAVVVFGHGQGDRTLMVSPALALPKRVQLRRGNMPGGNNPQRFMKAWDDETRLARVVSLRKESFPHSWERIDRRAMSKPLPPALIGLRIQIFPKAEYEALVKAGKLRKRFKGGEEWVMLITTKIGRKSSTQNPIGLKEFPEGAVGFQTFGEYVSFNNARIVGTLDPKWVKEKTKKD